MDVQLLEIGLKIKEAVVVAAKWCFRSVCSHPFFVSFLCVLVFLHSSFPFLFSLLVSASPVVVCTAVLLGTLLSYGHQSNIPEIEPETEVGRSHEAGEVLGGSAGIVEGFGVTGGRLVEEDVTVPLIGERSPEDGLRGFREDSDRVGSDDGGVSEAKRGLDGLRDEKSIEWGEESDGKIHYKPIPVADDDDDEEEEHIDSDGDGKSEGDSFGSEEVNVDSLDSPPCSPWRRVATQEEDLGEGDGNGDDDDDADSGSDEAESSSPDASMADIMPLLDELHPLLCREAPQPHHVVHDDDNENHKDLKVEDDEEGENEEDKKPVITWTEEDQKNLMDLGSSEVERNLRLESLILKRRAKKNAMRDLIDLESLDFAFDITPISTGRRNPFEPSHENSDLPPIPGSAPSVLVPRGNPFDIPYDSSEERPNLSGDVFLEEFTTSRSREAFYRKHESFSVRPSLLSTEQKEGEDVKMKPFFVAERTFSEGSSYSQFQRQSSELSYSKVSSVEDSDERKFSEDDDQQQVQEILPIKEGNGEDLSEDLELKSLNEEVTEGLNQELELTSILESPEHGHDSVQSSRVGKTDFRAEELKFELDDVTDQAEYLPHLEDVEQSYGSSSSSSSSEESERIFTEMNIGMPPVLEERTDDAIEESGISTQASLGSSELSTASAVVNEVLQREPVPESSPNLFSSYEVHPEADPSHSIELLTESSIDRLDVIGEHDEINIELSGIHQTSLASSFQEDLEKQCIWSEVSGSHVDENVHPCIDLPEDKTLDQAQEDKQLVISEADDVVEVVEPQWTDETRDSKVELQTFNVDDMLISTLAEGDSLVLQHPIEALATSTSEKLSEDNPETAIFHTDVQTVVEEVDEITDLDEALLTELDSIGDFSAHHWDSGSSEFEKHSHAVVESLSSVHHSETSRARATEVDSAEGDKIDSSRCSQEDIYVNDVPDAQTLIPSIDKGIDTSSIVEDLHLSDHEASEGWPRAEDEMKFDSAPTMVKDSVSAMLRAQGLGDAVPCQGQVDIGEMPEVEASKVEDIEMAFDKVVEETDRPVETENPVSDQPLATLPEPEANMIKDNEMALPELEARKVEDIGMTFKKVVEENERRFDPEKPVIEQSLAAMPELESRKVEDIEMPFKKIVEETEKPVSEQSLTLMPELQSSKVEDIETTFKKVVEETETPVDPEKAVLEQSLAAMPELQASKVEDIETIFKKVVEETEKPIDPKKVVSEQPLAAMQELHQASKVEDIETTFKKISEEIEKPIDPENPVSEQSLAAMPELLASRVEDIELTLVIEETEKPIDPKTAISEQSLAAMSELQASKVENTEETFKKVVEETEKPIDPKKAVLEQPSAAMLELQVSKVEDIETTFKKVVEETEKPIDPKKTVSEQTLAAMLELQASKVEDIETTFKKVVEETEKPIDPKKAVLEQFLTAMPELQASKVEDIETTFKKVVEETEKPIDPKKAVSKQSLAAMPELQASKAEDVDMAFKKVVEETERVVDLEKPVSEQSRAVMPELDATKVEDIEMAFKKVIVEEIEKPVLEHHPLVELIVGKTITLQMDMGMTGHNQDAPTLEIGVKEKLPDSVDNALEVAPVVSDGTSLPPKPVLEDDLVEHEGDNSGSSMEPLSAKEASSIIADELDTEIQVPKELDSIPPVKETGTISRTSSLSSGSEPSSSDSDKE